MRVCVRMSKKMLTSMCPGKSTSTVAFGLPTSLNLLRVSSIAKGLVVFSFLRTNETRLTVLKYFDVNIVRSTRHNNVIIFKIRV